VPIGVEVRILRNDGLLLYSRIFTSGEAAMAWATEERDELLAEEWTDLPGKVWSYRLPFWFNTFPAIALIALLYIDGRASQAR
jgi:hypothetical protein